MNNNHLHHFIVMFNDETQRWEWDTETEDALFGEGTLYAFDQDEWLYKDQTTKEAQEQNDKLAEKLIKQLDAWNNE